MIEYNKLIIYFLNDLQIIKTGTFFTAKKYHLKILLTDIIPHSSFQFFNSKTNDCYMDYSPIL